MNKRVDKPKTKLAPAKRGASSRAHIQNVAKVARAGIARTASADPHDPLLVLVRHTYALRVCRLYTFNF